VGECGRDERASNVGGNAPVPGPFAAGRALAVAAVVAAAMLKSVPAAADFRLCNNTTSRSNRLGLQGE
jgi:hypothetical protein